MLVKDIKEGSTAQVRQLDLQVFDELELLIPGKFSPITDLIESGKIVAGDGVFPYLQTGVKEALVKFLEEYRKPITITSAYRSIVAQVMLWVQKQAGLNPNLVAKPGRSNHGNGGAFDTPQYEELKNLLNTHGFAQTYPERDPVHFDYIFAQDYRVETIKAFQNTWNNANPKDPIAVDGILGDGTLEKINNSPAEGFPGLTRPRILHLTLPLQFGEDVIALQKALRASSETLKLDGFFGIGTELALKSFQTKQGFKADGVVGEIARAKLGLDKKIQ